MSKSSTKQQEHLITPVGFVLLVLVVVLLLIVLYPSKQTLFSGNQSADNLKTLFKDPTKLMYEQMLYQQSVSPRDVLDTVENLSGKGLWKESRHLLNTKLAGKLKDNERQEAALWMLQSHLDEYYISQNKDEKIERPLGEARAELQRFEQLEKLSVQELELLAQSSLEFGLVPQAINTYFRLSEVDTGHRIDWLDKAGSKAMSIQYYSDATKAYQLATAYGRNDAEYKTYLYAWLNAATKSGDKQMVANIVEGIESDLPENPIELEKLAAISLDIGRPSIAHRIYSRLATVDPKHAKRWYEKAGVWALSNTEHQQAANYFSQAEKLTSKPDEIERLKYKQYEALVDGEMPTLALNKVRALVNKHIDDEKLLKKGVNLALAAKDPETARKWNLRYLQKHPDDFTALQRQADIEIRDKQYGKALTYIQQILSLKPSHIETRKKLAFLQESQGHDVKALKQWQSIHKIEHKAEYQKHIMRLAQATINQGIGLGILLQASKHQKLPEQTIQDIVTYYYKQKNFIQAELFLARYLRKYTTNRDLWRRLASLQKDQADIALLTWDKIETLFGSTQETVLTRFELLWKLERKAEALQVYDNAQPKVAINSRFHHQILAELAWEFDRFDLALKHFHVLLKGANKQSQVAYFQRISSIHLKRKDDKAAMQTFNRAWTETSNADLLLQALQIAFEKRLNKDLNNFLKISMQNEHLFDENIGYWQLRAQLASKAQQYTKAHAYYETMLAIEPNSIVARQGIIWVLTQTKQKDELHKTLVTWQPIAAKEERLWASYALGLQALGEVRTSLPWYKHYIDKNRNDFAMLLSYADQLDRLDRNDSAYRIRRFALHNLRRFLRKNKISDEQRKEALFQYLGVVQRYGSLENFETLHKKLQGDYSKTSDQTRLNEIAIAWMLSTKQDDKARYQLVKAHEQRLKTPLWQLLAIAIKKKDKKGINELLANAKGLTLENRVSALLASGKESRAYRLALKGIDEKRLPKEREQARLLALSMANDNASSITFELEQKRLGNLNLQSEGFTYKKGMKPDFPFAYDLAIRKNRLNYDDFSKSETDISATGHWKNEDNRIDGTVGINHREDGNLYYAKLQASHTFSERLNASVEFGKNEVATEGSLLRIAGKRDRIKANINAKVGKQAFAHASVWQHQFSTRDGDKLADGHGLSGSIVHKEKMGSSQWHVGVQGQVESNQTVDHLPSSIQAMAGEQGSIISENPKSAGIIAGISHGSPGHGVPQVNSPRYSANAWLGKSWPTNKAGVNLEASVGSRILGNDELSATAFVNTVAGSNGQTDQGITVQYRKWFDTDLDSERYRIEQ